MPRATGPHRPAVIEWPIAIPACARCGEAHWGCWMTRLDDGGWVGDVCLTDDERRRWCRRKESP